VDIWRDLHNSAIESVWGAEKSTAVLKEIKVAPVSFFDYFYCTV
jgi:hypothetical protein